MLVLLDAPESAAWRENRGHRGGSGCQEGARSEERSVVGNYVSTAEVRLTTQTGPSHPHPGVGGVSTPRRLNATPG
ncbi:MAG: hypothetical protein GX934_12970, partial [Burkholderiales bacterium]|nr:hypothetical protein [Burkholderiales bacterium]